MARGSLARAAIVTGTAYGPGRNIGPHVAGSMVLDSLRSLAGPIASPNVEWLAALDLQRALTNCHVDLRGDWYRDPWGWPELNWSVRQRRELIVGRLNATGARRVSRIDVPKAGFSTRPAMVMDPLDRLCYQSLVDALSIPLIGELPRWVFGWRLRRKEPTRGNYSSNGEEWRGYRERLRRLATVYPSGLQTDVVSFFASIPVERLCGVVSGRARNDIGRRLNSMLIGWSRVPGRSGLPQRAMASSALANMYLRPVDDTIEAAAAGPRAKAPFRAAARWMDDIWVFGDDLGWLRHAQLRLESGLRDLGLDMSTAKTKVLSGAELLAAVLEIEHGYIDVSLAESPPNPKPLEELVDKLVGAPEAAARTSIRFASTRIRATKRWDLAEKFAPVADRMPQGADHLGRLFRESSLWRVLGDWYVSYCASPWAAVEWGPAQLGTMFPARTAGPDVVANLFAELIPQHRSLPLVALAASRLASWSPSVAREVLRESAKRSTDPLERRVLALALLIAHEEHHVVGAILTEYEENEATRLMLEDSKFRTPSASRDYEGEAT